MTTVVVYPVDTTMLTQFCFLIFFRMSLTDQNSDVLQLLCSNIQVNVFRAICLVILMTLMTLPMENSNRSTLL